MLFWLMVTATLSLCMMRFLMFYVEHMKKRKGSMVLILLNGVNNSLGMCSSPYLSVFHAEIGLLINR